MAVVNIFFGKETVMGEENIDSNGQIIHRTGEEHSDWAGGLHRLPGRTFWTLSWIQHHLVFGDCLLGSHWLF